MHTHCGLLSSFSLSPGLSRPQGPGPWRRRGQLLGLPPVCLCHCHKGKGTSLPLVWEPPVTSPPSLPSEASLCSSAEGRRPEEGSLCPGHAGHETLPAVRSERAGLGRRTSEQQATELLLLRGPWGVSEGKKSRASHGMGVLWW